MGQKILFVDDEQNILKSIRRNFILSDMEVFTADSPKKAFSIIEENNIDIIISDVKMPEMNGIEFLTIVKEKFPDINRVILSGFVERESVLKAINTGVAFDYFTKPWDNEILHQKIKHILSIRDMLKNDDIRKLVNGIDELPRLPEVSRKFSLALEKDESIHVIGDIISEDVSLTAKILQIVNSAFYSGEKVSSIERAVSIIGLNSMKNIILTSSFMEDSKLSSESKLYLAKEINKTLRLNKIFVRLYELKYKSKKPEEYMSLGLLYNIGRLIILKCFPERYKATINKMEKNKKLDFYQAEVELGYSGISHTEIGAYFLDLWNFSGICIETALFHHNIDHANSEIKPILKMLRMSEKIIKTLSQDYEKMVMNQSVEEWKSSGIVDLIVLGGELDGL